MLEGIKTLCQNTINICDNLEAKYKGTKEYFKKIDKCINQSLDYVLDGVPNLMTPLGISLTALTLKLGLENINNMNLEQALMYTGMLILGTTAPSLGQELGKKTN